MTESVVAPARPLRILVLTKNPVEDGVGGELLLHRHIRASPANWQYRFHHLGDGTLQPSTLFSRVIHRCSRRYTRLLTAWDACKGISVQLKPLLHLCAEYKPDLLYSIADGPVAARVAQVSKRTGIPWVAQLNDWFPTGLDVPRKLEPLIANSYRTQLHSAAALICFSPELFEAADKPANGRVLYPIAETVALDTAPSPGSHLLFAGRFDHFLGPEMKSLLRLLQEKQQTDLLRILGPDAHWDNETRLLINHTSIYHGMRKGRELHRELATAGALLVMAPFGPERAHIARYSFPSKIPDYCGHSRPIIVWGPETCSSVRWARRSGAALVVNSSDPSQVLRAMHELATDPARAAAHVAAARQEAATTFRAENMQSTFEQSILAAVTTV